MKELQSDELFPRHVKALADAVRLMDLHVDPKARKTAREAMKIVRELAAQHRLRRWSNTL